MKIDTNNNKHIIADDGKMLYRKSDGSGPFKEVILGMHKNGFLIYYETVNDYEERDENNVENQ